MASGIKYTTNEVLEILKQYNYVLLDAEYKNARTKMNLQDKEGFRYEITLGNIMSGKKPNKIHPNNNHTLYNMQHMIRLDGRKTILLTKDYHIQKQKMNLICECGREYTCTADKLVNKKQFICTNCSIQEKGKNSRVEYSAVKELFDSKGYTLLSDYQGCEEPLDFVDSEGYKGRISYANLRFGFDFSKISNNNIYVIDNIKNYISIHNIPCKLISTSYINAYEDLEFECECGNKFLKSWNQFSTRNSTKCKVCSGRESSLELLTRKYLEKHNIKFVQEYGFPDEEVRYLRFDFAVFKDNCLYKLIEVDGRQHFEKVAHWQDDEGFERQKELDFLKDAYCKKNNIPLIRLNWKMFRSKKEYKNVINKEIIECI